MSPKSATRWVCSKSSDSELVAGPALPVVASRGRHSTPCALRCWPTSGDREIADRAVDLLKDPDLGVRTEAMLYLTREMHVDPLSQIQKLGDFEDFSIRAGMAAFLASPGPTQNVIAARALIEGMVNEPGEAGAREREEAARLIALVPEGFLDLLQPPD